jgi:DNA invertase Pin-like site-specific DNA recombinase
MRVAAVIQAFSYLRVSSPGQADPDKDGLPRQRRAVSAWAEANGVIIAQEFAEPASGATEGMDRPGWRALMLALLASGVETVVIERLDRLARDLMVQETVIADLRKRGFKLVSTAEPDLMANDPTRVLIRQLLGAVAQYDKAQIVAKLRAGNIRKRQLTGRSEGRKPYGQHPKLPAEAAVLARMRELRGAGSSLEAIAVTLNAEGVAPRRGQRWHASAVRSILLRSCGRVERI